MKMERAVLLHVEDACDLHLDGRGKTAGGILDESSSELGNEQGERFALVFGLSGDGQDEHRRDIGDAHVLAGIAFERFAESLREAGDEL